ncbi:hypothetical protein HOD30_02540 [Candidatus Peregrinibacteria bacterium]|jgi:hypothetical protein|nr:hypothetical protein [Candidatus Peregrinibacteria bacterium]MBT4632118.1 hypothetical protein [Candidatus Peregrinibacteria bacterium]MBT5516689.1 hypothetical protein [Candidatus Peregrinibacteria bacterium]MBT5823528.1 hypothetical protein [Candidatus Peregrinibacteria bacterium]
MEETIAIILAAASQIGFYAFIFWIIKFANKKTFSKLLEKYSIDNKPTNKGVITGTFSIGTKVKSNKIIRIREAEDALQIKVPFGKFILIPLSEFASITGKPGLFQRFAFTLKFKDTSLLPINFSIKQVQLNLFPKISGTIQQTDLNPKQKPQYLSQVFNSMKFAEAKEKGANIIRAMVLIFTIIALIGMIGIIFAAQEKPF